MNNIKFTGTKEQYLDGIPARDLTQAEWDGLSPAARENAISSGLYQVQNEAAFVSKKKTAAVEE